MRGNRKKYGVELLVCSSLNRNSGTMVREKTKMEKMLISGVAADKNVAKIRVAGLGNDPESTFRLLNLLDRNNLNIDVMIQSLGKDGTKSVSFTVAKPDMLRTIDVLNDNKDSLGIKSWIMMRTWQRFPSSEPVSAPIRAWLPKCSARSPMQESIPR